MNPFALRVLALAVGTAVSFAVGWHVNGWRKDAEIYAITAEMVKGRSDQAQAALTDLATAAARIRTAADGYTADSAALGAKLDQLRKDFKNAKPLPADCRPDTFRMRHLSAAIDAANEAATGQ